MNFKVIDNFIDINQCEKLIQDAEKYCYNDHINVLNDRLLLPSTSDSFINLLKKSKCWNNLHKNLNSEIFLSNILKHLKLKNDMFRISNFYNNDKYSKLHKKFKDINSKKIVNISSKGLIFYLLFKTFRNFQRNLKYKFTKNNYVELLYDYSKSPNGYHREIHRDSDSRTIVFLLYLNKLTEGASGGELCFHSYKYNNLKIPSQPQEKDCELIQSIPPMPGRLVVFMNTHESLHSVNIMKNHNGFRHFLYGSFTLLGKKNNQLSKSIGSLPTNFSIFD